MGYELITDAIVGDIIYDSINREYYVYVGNEEWLYVGTALHWYGSEEFEPDGEYEEA